MDDIIELKATDLAAMLCSRVCHDLINPVGAIGNGLEVLADRCAAVLGGPVRGVVAPLQRPPRARSGCQAASFGEKGGPR